MESLPKRTLELPKRMKNKETSEMEPYNPFEQMSFEEGACFLCGQLPDEQTREHVFPLWLLKRQGLLDATISLLNRTTIPYRQLTVPCCKRCNNVHLKKLEDIIEQATKDGASAVRLLPEELLFQWMAKILWGILWKENQLKNDRKNQNSETIVPSEALESLNVLHGHLQSVRRNFIFEGVKPWSIFISDIQEHSHNEDFDYHDFIPGLCFGIRFSGVGLIACLQDNSAQKRYFDEQWTDLKGIPLHRIQWDEIWARIIYRQMLLQRVPKYMTILPANPEDPVTVISLPVQGFAPDSVWADWNSERYARCLLSVIRLKDPGVKLSDIYRPPNAVKTWLFKPDGTLFHFDASGKE